MRKADSLQELKIKFSGNASNSYPSSNYDIYVREGKIYSVSTNNILVYSIDGVILNILKLTQEVPID